MDSVPNGYLCEDLGGQGNNNWGIIRSQLGKHEEVLPWSRAQQAAFLIYMGGCVREAIQDSKDRWAKSLRAVPVQGKIGKVTEDPAFYGPHTLLTADQGIRGLLYVTNDICYVRAKELKLQNWVNDSEAGASDEEAVRAALGSLKVQPVAAFLKDIAEGLSKYDWRTSSFPTSMKRNEFVKLRCGEAAVTGSFDRTF